MTQIHAHLILNHVPLIGTVIGLLLLVYAVVRREDAVAKASLAVFALTAVVAVIVFLTGEAAEEAVENLAGVSHATIEAHEDASLFGLIALSALALASVGALFFSRGKKLGKSMMAGILVLAVITSGVMAWVGNLGGQINHPEIRPAAAVDASAPASYDEAVDHDDDGED